MSIEYLAGLFDGEGTVSLEKKYKRIYRSPVVSVASTTKELVDACQAEFGGCIVTKSEKRKAHHKQCWIWKQSNDAAIDVCRKFLPFTLEPKKKARMQFIVTHYKQLTKSNGKYSPAEIAAKQTFEDDFFKL